MICSARYFCQLSSVWWIPNLTMQWDRWWQHSLLLCLCTFLFKMKYEDTETYLKTEIIIWVSDVGWIWQQNIIHHTSLYQKKSKSVSEKTLRSSFSFQVHISLLSNTKFIYVYVFNCSPLHRASCCFSG